MAEEEGDLGGWGPKAWDLLKDRVDALRADVNVVLGRAPAPKNGDPRIGGIGIATWIALFATIVVPLVGIAVAVIKHSP